MIPLVICPKKDCRKTCEHKEAHEHNVFCDEDCISPLREEVLAHACIPYGGVQPTECTPDNTKVPLPV